MLYQIHLQSFFPVITIFVSSNWQKGNNLTVFSTSCLIQFTKQHACASVVNRTRTRMVIFLSAAAQVYAGTNRT